MEISWKGNQDITTTDEEASHPNDKAFKIIADRILHAIAHEFEGL